PLRDYSENLKHAIVALDSLKQTDEDETPAGYEIRLAQTLEAVEAVLPGTQVVEAEGEGCSVENSWIHKQLEAIRSDSGPAREKQIQYLIERLQAIQERLAVVQGPVGAAGKQQSKEKLQSILSRTEYQTSHKDLSALTRFVNDILRWIEKLFP